MAGSSTDADVVLVGCVKTKHDKPMAAQDLYCSPLFRKRRRYAEATGKPWVIVSALHGIVLPGTVVEPYDVSLQDLPGPRRDVWAQLVISQLQQCLDGLYGKVFELHMSQFYIAYLWVPLRQWGIELRCPLEGLMLGEQLRWYNERWTELP